MSGLLILFALLSLADGWTTWQVIRFGGREMWLPKYVMGWIGTYNALLVLKIGVVALVWAINIYDPLPIWFMAVVNFGYAGLIIHNYIQLEKQKNETRF